MSIKEHINNTFLFITFISLLVLFFACSSDEKNPVGPRSITEADIIGEWKLSSLCWTTSYSSQYYCQEELDSMGVVWELIFNEDKSAEHHAGETVELGVKEENGSVKNITPKQIKLDL